MAKLPMRLEGSSPWSLIQPPTVGRLVSAWFLTLSKLSLGVS
jgi:hypothetical protein